MHELGRQAYAFFSLVLAGSAAGVLFDLLRVLRGRLGPRSGWEAALDLLFWGVLTLVLGTALLGGGHGHLRFYVPVALGLGAWLYFALASHTASRVLAGLVAATGRAVEWFVAAGRAVWRPLAGGLRLLRAAAAWLLRPAVSLGSPLLRGLRAWLFPPGGDGAGEEEGPE